MQNPIFPILFQQFLFLWGQKHRLQYLLKKHNTVFTNCSNNLDEQELQYSPSSSQLDPPYPLGHVQM